MASFIYVINDIKDVEKDRNHPSKKNRPIASNKISIKKALVFAIFLIIISLLLNFSITKVFSLATLYLILYLFINILYSFGMKNIAILDVILLASGFILRVYFGAAIINVTVSNFLFLTILNASLFLGLGKRYKEIQLKNNVRKVLENYNERFLESFINITICLVIVFYSLWIMDHNNDYLYYSIPILTIIIMQYMLNMYKGEECAPTTIFFQNKFLIITTIIYILYMFITMVVIR